MEPSAIFQKFANRIFQLSLLQRASRHLFREEFGNLVEIKESSGKFSSLNNFIYYGAADGRLKMLSPRIEDIDQALANCRFHKIKQYQWLLAEAYEGFEDFLEEIYAAVGMRRPSVWLMSDFGSIAYGKLDEESFEWFLDRARRKKDRPYSIIERIRENSDSFARLEVQSAREANYRILLVIIEKLRHVIVHNSGYIEDIDTIVAKALGQSGKDNRFKDSMRNIFDTYWELHDGRKLVNLLEVSVGPDNSLYAIGAVNDTLDQFLKLLVEYADLITETVEGFGPRS